MDEQPTSELVVVVHHAGTWTEAVVLRGLLESAGIESPAPTSTDPFPMREPPQGMHGVEILVLESRADEARHIIASYLKNGAEPEQPGEDTGDPSAE